VRLIGQKTISPKHLDAEVLPIQSGAVSSHCFQQPALSLRPAAPPARISQQHRGRPFSTYFGVELGLLSPQHRPAPQWSAVRGVDGSRAVMTSPPRAGPSRSAAAANAARGITLGMPTPNLRHAEFGVMRRETPEKNRRAAAKFQPAAKAPAGQFRANHRRRKRPHRLAGDRARPVMNVFRRGPDRVFAISLISAPPIMLFRSLLGPRSPARGFALVRAASACSPLAGHL